MVRVSHIFLLAIAAAFSARTAVSDERRDRNADRAALSALEAGIAKLKKSSASRSLGGAEKEMYLARLAEMQILRAEFFFRIDHGEAHLRKSALTLSRAKGAYGDAAATLTRFLSVYPGSSRVPWALFTRGKAYEEMGEKGKAKADYLRFVEGFPKDPRCDAAYMALAAFANEAEDAALAMKYLLEVEKRPESPYHVTALHQLSWAYYNLKRIRSALNTLSRHIALLRERKDKDSAENVSGDVALFYLEGFESDPDEFTLKGAMAEIQKTLGGEFSSRAYTRFARLLKAHGHLGPLSKWRELVYGERGASEEASEIASLLLEERFARRDWKELEPAIKDLLRSTTPEGRAKAESRLLEMAEEIQKMVMKNLASTEVKVLTRALTTVYDAFVEDLASEDVRGGQAHYNLAEALFRTEEYAAATLRYRQAIGFVQDAELKSVSSRHLELKRAKMIPESLSAFVPKNESDEPRILREWIGWIDALQASGKPLPGADGFAFDAARALYALGEREESMARLAKVAHGASDGKLRLASAALILDTHVASSDWTSVHRDAEAFLARKDWADVSFSEKLRTLASDSFFQITLTTVSAGSGEERLAAASECARRYPKGKHAAECALLAGKAAIELGRKDQAKELLSGAGELEGALLLRASILESEHDLLGATASLMRSLAKRPDDGVRKQVLYLSWVSGDAKKIEEALRSPLVCGHASAPKECELYRLVKSVREGRITDYAHAFRMSARATAEQRSIWAIAAMRAAERTRVSLPFQDRIVLLQRLGDSWKGLPTDISLVLAGECDAAVAAQLGPIAKAVPAIAPVRAEEDALLRRVRILQDAEKAMGKAASVPFARTKLRLIVSVAGLYRGFVGELAGLMEANKELRKPLGELFNPLEEKTKTIEAQIADSAPIRRVAALDRLGAPLPVSLFWKEAQGLGPQALLYRAGAEKDSDRAQILRGVAFLEAGALAEGAELLSEKMDSLSSGERAIASLLVLTRDWEAVPRGTLLPFVGSIRSGRGPASEDARARVVKALEEAGLFEGGPS